MKFIKNFILAGMLLIVSNSVFSSSLPTTEEVQGIINVCAAGRSVEVQGELSLSFKKLFSGGVDGEGKISDLGGIIANIEDDKLKVEVFKLYHSCIMPLLLSYTENTKKDDSEEEEIAKTQYIQTSYENYKVDLVFCKRLNADIFCKMIITNLGSESGFGLDTGYSHGYEFIDENGNGRGDYKLALVDMGEGKKYKYFYPNTSQEVKIIISNVPKKVSKFMKFYINSAVDDVLFKDVEILN